MRVGIACIVIAVGLAAAFGGAYWLAARALAASEQALCPVLEIITSQPAPRPADPAANPSRVEAWRLYADSRAAERAYRCAG